MATVAEFCARPVIPEATTMPGLAELMLAANYLDIASLLQATSDRLGSICAAVLKGHARVGSDLFDMSAAATERAECRAVLQNIFDQE